MPKTAQRPMTYRLTHSTPWGVAALLRAVLGLGALIFILVACGTATPSQDAHARAVATIPNRPLPTPRPTPIPTATTIPAATTPGKLSANPTTVYICLNQLINVTLSNVGGQELTWTVQFQGPFSATANPSQGSLAPGASQTVSLSVNFTSGQMQPEIALFQAGNSSATVQIIRPGCL